MPKVLLWMVVGSFKKTDDKLSNEKKIINGYFKRKINTNKKAFFINLKEAFILLIKFKSMKLKLLKKKP